MNIVAYCLLLPVLVIAAGWDVRTGKVPNWLTYSAVLVGVAVWTVAGVVGVVGGVGVMPTEVGTPGGLGGVGGVGAVGGAWWSGLAWSLGGFAAGFFPFLVMSMMGGLGGGDVKLMGAVGALSASWRVVLATSVYALLVAFLIALYLMFRHGLVKRTMGRIATAAVMSAHRVKPAIPGDSPKIPFAVAVAVGGALAGAEGMLGVWTPWASLGP